MKQARAVLGGRLMTEKRKLLVVDDSMTALILHKVLLARGGFDVVVARDGEEALEVARAERPDLVLMDVVMPKMDGLEACRRLRAESARVPIIMVSTRGECDSLEAAYASGCTEYVTKPVDGAELLAKIWDVLGR